MIQCANKRREVQLAHKQLQKTYTFDGVYGPESTQAELYETTVSPIVEEVLKGFNCTVFAYGQTGTGKTYTMEGSWQANEDAGIIPRAIQQIFKTLESGQHEYTVHVSYLELYNEELYDLLSPDATKTLRIFDDQSGRRGITVQNLEEVIVNSAADIMKILEVATARRQVAETNCNHASSRSHAIFSVNIHTKEITSEGEELLKIGKLNLVDLAGSENVGRSGAKDKQKREAGMINTSLLTLGRVITALTEHSPHVPYRESKLTRLLQESLGGRTKTTIVATISPAVGALDETLSTLEYAYRAKSIKNKPEINAKMTKRSLMKEYTVEIERLRQQLFAARSGTGFYVTQELWEEMTNTAKTQKERIEELETAIATKERELAAMLTMFQAKEAECERTTEKLKVTESTLQTTKSALQDAKTSLAEHAALITEYAATESKLHDSAGQMLGTITESVAHVDGLRRKLERKARVEEENKKRGSDFHRRFAERMSHFEGNLMQFAQVQATQHAALETALRASADARAKELDAAAARLADLERSLQTALATRAAAEGAADEAAQRAQREHAAELAALAAAAQEASGAFERSARATVAVLRDSLNAQRHEATAWAAAAKRAADESEAACRGFAQAQRQAMAELADATREACAAQATRVHEQQEALEALGKEQGKALAQFQATAVAEMARQMSEFVARQEASFSGGLQQVQRALFANLADAGRLQAEVTLRAGNSTQAATAFLERSAAAGAEARAISERHVTAVVSHVGAAETEAAQVEALLKGHVAALTATEAARAAKEADAAKSVVTVAAARRTERERELSATQEALKAGSAEVVSEVGASSEANSAACTAAADASAARVSECGTFGRHCDKEFKAVRAELTGFFGALKEDTPTGETPVKKTFKTAYDIPKTKPRDLSRRASLKDLSNTTSVIAPPTAQL